MDIACAINGNPTLGQQFSWNYDHGLKLWEHYGWVNNATQAQASPHYAAYSVVHPLGLRIITLNTDLYYSKKPRMWAACVGRGPCPERMG